MKSFLAPLKYDLDSLFFDLKDQSLAVGVSGGPDSLSLIFSLHHWGKAKKLSALTVDHQLRKESFDEAQTVKEWMNTLGIEHHILTWDHPPIINRIQERARQARYQLMGDFCMNQNISYLLVAHHADDQNETFLMRLLKGSTLRGLSCMKRLTKAPFGYIVRPFLHLPKNDLCINHSHIKDPSNYNEAFERVKIRKILNALPYHCLNKSIVHLSKAFDYIEHEVQKALLTCYEHPFIIKSKLLLHHPFLVKEIIHRILQKVGMKKYPCSPKTLRRVANALSEEDFKGITAGGCYLKKTKNDRIIVLLEQRRAIL